MSNTNNNYNNNFGNYNNIYINNLDNYRIKNDRRNY
jgi:hypothetical protein